LVAAFLLWVVFSRLIWRLPNVLVCCEKVKANLREASECASPGRPRDSEAAERDRARGVRGVGFSETFGDEDTSQCCKRYRSLLRQIRETKAKAGRGFSARGSNPRAT